MLFVLLALSSTAMPAGAKTSHLVPSSPWLAAPPAAPVTKAASDPAAAVPVARREALPSTGFPIAPELLMAGVLLCAGTALRARARHRGIVRLEPALARRR